MSSLLSLLLQQHGSLHFRLLVGQSETIIIYNVLSRSLHDYILSYVGSIADGTHFVLDAHIFDGLLTEDATAAPQGYESIYMCVMVTTLPIAAIVDLLTDGADEGKLGITGGVLRQHDLLDIAVVFVDSADVCELLW